MPQYFPMQQLHNSSSHYTITDGPKKFPTGLCRHPHKGCRFFIACGNQR